MGKVVGEKKVLCPRGIMVIKWDRSWDPKGIFQKGIIIVIKCFRPMRKKESSLEYSELSNEYRSYKKKGMILEEYKNHQMG